MYHKDMGCIYRVNPRNAEWNMAAPSRPKGGKQHNNKCCNGQRAFPNETTISADGGLVGKIMWKGHQLNHHQRWWWSSWENALWPSQQEVCILIQCIIQVLSIYRIGVFGFVVSPKLSRWYGRVFYSWEQALICLSNREIVDASRGRTFHCKMANNRFF